MCVCAQNTGTLRTTLAAPQLVFTIGQSEQSESWKHEQQRVVQAEVVHLLGEVEVLVVRHASGDVVYDLGGGGGVVRRGLPSAAVPLQAPHEAAVSGEVHLRDEADPCRQNPPRAPLRGAKALLSTPSQQLSKSY